MNTSGKWALALLMASGLAVLPARQAEAVSTTTTYIQLFSGQPEAFVNGEKMRLDIPVQSVEEAVYVPLKWMGERLDFNVDWNGETGKVQVQAPKAFIEFDLAENQVAVNGKSSPMSGVAKIEEDRLLVKLSWIADYIGMQTKYYAGQRRTDIIYIQNPTTRYKESALPGDELPNSRPVAKFMFGKDSYRIGEPVDYIDLSYDPDAEGLPGVEWKGRQDAFFKPGDYTVSLKVTDPKGNVSDEFSRTLHIEDKVYLDPFQYSLHYVPPGSILKADKEAAIIDSSKLAAVSKQVHQYEERPLVSVVTNEAASGPAEKGFYYQEKIKGKARLYINHFNRGTGKEQLGIVIRNASGSKPVTVKTTRHGESAPSLFYRQLSPQAVADFLLSHAEDSELTVKPLDAAFYKQFEPLSPGQGLEALYDIETDGEAIVSIVTTSPGETIYDLGQYRMLEGKTKLRGTFPAADILWNADVSRVNVPSRLTIGGDDTDKLLKGRDALTGKETGSASGSGVTYTVRLERPGKAALVLVPRGGYFQGPVKVGGKIVAMPQNSVLTPLDGGLLLHRTTGAEPAVEVEWTSTSGSLLPVDLLVYPLEDGE
ncbi:stalk domain-containing protein [Paenibacillus hamazuiensis]|uniref:stalk domain-containing protein n=1 Tax=Paenibacillus hamazuiensis TaxID=2936508 RepID=UPI00200BE249|nr:copper amine oxidase N-terminal domain-containing protein [Paenibacillus hamazuiensis]